MKKYLILLGIIVSFQSFSQDDLMKMLDNETKNETDYTSATFKGTRLINGQTIETTSKNHLNFWISHRFGAVNSGFIENFFGLDQARIRLGLEYGITDQLTIGVGRSSQEKTYDYYAKYKVLRQSNKVPITMTVYLSGAANTLASGSAIESGSVLRFTNNLQRQTYCTQLLIARKFSNEFSLQLMPTFLHYNKTEGNEFQNDKIALGVGGRYKLSKRLSLNVEYYWVNNSSEEATFKQVNPLKPYPYHNSLAVGFDIETGGHVFQLHFTNSRGMIERHFIGQTMGTWENGDIFYGFNIARTFSFDKKAKQSNPMGNPKF
jgi:Membrane bound beta barrel domain (DUF5777)